MASRLDRLVLLLDTGSTKLIRNTAAQQLADIQKKHPHELYNLLTRVTPFLRSKSWDTRIAAAEAIGGIVKNRVLFDPNVDDGTAGDDLEDEIKSEQPERLDDHGIPPADDQLQLETLDANTIITQGKQLLGSAGREYDYFINAMDPVQRLSFQKKSLSARLGLGGQYVEDELITDSDIMKTNSQPPGPPGLSKIDTSLSHADSSLSDLSQTAFPETPGEDSGLSKRQLNMLKRKSKKELKGQASKVQALDLGQKRPAMSDSRSQELPTRTPQIKSEESQQNGVNGSADYFNLERSQAGDDDTKMVSEFKGEQAPVKPELQTEGAEEGREWPFELLTDYLMVDLFDHNWEVRHGAAIGLREILLVHGAGAGRERGKARPANDLLNQRWLNDLSCRCMAVFMLDRFGDYVSDKVTAPVREAVGQVFGALLKYMSSSAVHMAFTILSTLVRQDQINVKERLWQACHGGMIGLRYLVAVRTDLLLSDSKLMDGVLDCVLHGLEDGDDDVRVVSADTLIPVSRDIVDLRPNILGKLVSIIWESLASLSDDLSSSTGSIMDLLAKLCTFPEVLDIMKQNASTDPDQTFSSLVPRLFPFLRHAITGVRSAVLRALQRFALMEGEGGVHWINGKTLRLVFQNLLVERNEGVLKQSLDLWNSLVDALLKHGTQRFHSEMEPHVAVLTTLTLHPFGIERNHIPANPSLFIRPSGQPYSMPSNALPRSPSSTSSDSALKKRKKSAKPDPESSSTAGIFHGIDNPMILGDLDLVTPQVMIRSKIFASRALGKLISAMPEDSRVPSFEPALNGAFTSRFASTRLIASMVCEEFSKLLPNTDQLCASVTENLQKLVDTEEPQYYTDIVNFLRVAQQQCKVLQNKLIHDCGGKSTKVFEVAPKVQGEDETCGPWAFSLERAEQIRDTECDKAIQAMSAYSRKIAETALTGARKDVEKSVLEAREAKQQRDTRIKAAAAAAIVALGAVPPKKPSSTIKGLMDSVKTEENLELQTRSAAGVVQLVRFLVQSGKTVPMQRLVGNVVKFYCGDSSETPVFSFNGKRTAEILSVRKDETIEAHADQSKFEREAKEARIKRRGARDTLEKLCTQFGSEVFDKVPTLRTLLEQPLVEVFAKELPVGIEGTDDNGLGQQAIDAMSLLRAIVAHLEPSLHSTVLELVPLITKALRSRLSVFRYIAAKCFATVCSVMPVQGFTILVKDVLPQFEEAEELFPRQGAIECIYHLINAMGDRILPFVIFLISPVLGRMSDSDADTRQIATVSFATLIKLVPLEAGIPDPPGMSQEMLAGRETERKFIAQMLDPKSIDGFSLPVAIKATLRSYQQDGVNWLAFLNRYNLHGILCDDMGLGKTLQTICIVASDHHNRAMEFEATGKREKRPLPSLIVCPATLSGHWAQEIAQYAPFLKITLFVGPPAERGRRRADIATADIVITSYEVCRNESKGQPNDPLRCQAWNYCVLDEGHLIKNHESKISVAVKKLSAYHRLILSGTPIQNNVLELWSLFDFLMPGFLGTREIFNSRFVKPIAASRTAKSDSKSQEAGALALEALHKQVQPFLLRRLKEEVLDDLPPKILQNYYCDLSELQKRLYTDFARKEVKSLETMAGEQSKEAKQHIFTALNYMRKLCNSPALVLNEKHKAWNDTQEYLRRKNSTLSDPSHAPKLDAIRNLLLDCGIGTADALPDSDSSSSKKSSAAAAAAKSTDQAAIANSSTTLSPHRALVFCQMTAMLDILVAFLQTHMPSVTFLRLDGSIESTSRQALVNKFNSDPSIDLLLLTTSVGGLGLNLTGADTVIFVEHDWNPQKDIQAMDRAHRIGQKRVVNVYRLISRGTLEEKILNLQRFKVDVASSVVKQQKSAGLGGLQTGEILDLFNLDENDSIGGGGGTVEGASGGGEDGGGSSGNAAAGAVDEVTGEVREKGKKGFLDDLGELWDERQYEETYDLDEFLSKMKG